MLTPESNTLLSNQEIIENLPKTAKLFLQSFYNLRFDGGCGSVYFASKDDLYSRSIGMIYSMNENLFGADWSLLLEKSIIVRSCGFYQISIDFDGIVKNIDRCIPDTIENLVEPKASSLLSRLRTSFAKYILRA
jgi:hypothetical protein